MRKRIGIIGLSLALSVVGAGTALASWNQDERGWWFQYEDGRYAKSGVREVEGGTFCFDGDGYMQTGWQYVNWKWYYFEEDGTQAVGWKELEGNWYYLDPKEEGAMQTYWLDLEDPNKKGKINRYYFDEAGILKIGTFYLSDETNGSSYAYKTDENGVLIRNKKMKSGDTEIRYDEDGRIRFRNAQTKRNAEIDGTDEWQYLLSESEMERIYSESDD